MLTVSPSISPLSYNSILISPASVSIRFTSAFSRVVSTRGSVETRFLFSLMILMGRAIVSVDVAITGLSFVAFTVGGLVVFLLAGFATVIGLFAAVVVDFTTVGGGTFGAS